MSRKRRGQPRRKRSTIAEGLRIHKAGPMKDRRRKVNCLTCNDTGAVPVDKNGITYQPCPDCEINNE